MWLRAAAAALLWLLGALPCFAAPVLMLRPPAKYDHAFAGRLVMKLDVKKGSYWGWTYGPSHGVCVIHLTPKGTRFEDQVMDAASFARMVRHETAHCNGWGQNHPGGVWVG